MEKKKLFTFGILAYNNYSLIKNAIDSVLEQDYPEIELIINNDGSKDFDENELSKYIEENKKENLKNYIIHNSLENKGTVKSVNYICSVANGEYFMLMAADDALFCNGVFSRYVEEFEKDTEIKIVMSKVAMCDEHLKRVMEYIPSNENIELLKRADSKEIFSRLSHDSFMPTTSICFKYELLKETNFYNEEYFIIEDASKFLYLARNGYKFHWIDDFCAAKHRDGGISHGNTRNKSESYRRYRFDELILYVNEILPYVEMILPKDKMQMEKKWDYLKGAYYRDFLLNDSGKIEYRSYDIKVCTPLIRTMKKDMYREKLKNIFRERAAKTSLKREIKSMVVLLFFMYLTTLVNVLTNEYMPNYLEGCLSIEVHLRLIWILFSVLLLEKMLSVAMRVLADAYKIIKKYK